MNLRTISDDAAAAARNVRRHPRNPILLAVIMTCAIGILLAIFDCARQVLGGALPFRDPANIVLGDPHSSGFLVSPYNWQPNPRSSEVFDQVAEFHLETDILDSQPRPQSVLIAYVTPGFFTTLGVRMALGGDLPDAAPPSPAAHLDWLPVIISHHLWRNDFKSDPGIVGHEFSTKLLYPYRFLVVGVAPAGASFPPGVDAWVPEHLTSQSTVQTAAVPNWVDTAVARLRPGLSVTQAEAAIRSWPRNNVMWNWDDSARLIPLREYLGGDFYRLGPPLRLITILFLALSIAAALSIWCRGFDERRDALTISRYLGATPGRLLRSRSLELAAALAAALVLAFIARAAVLRIVSHALRLPPVRSTAISAGDLGMAGSAIALLVLLVCAREARQLGAFPTLLGIHRGHRREKITLRAADGLRLPVTLVTAAVVLITSILLARSSYLASRIDPGLRPTNVFVCDVALPFSGETTMSSVNPALPEKKREQLMNEGLLEFHRRVSFDFSLITQLIQGRTGGAAGVISVAPYSGYPPTGGAVSVSSAPEPPRFNHLLYPHIVSMDAGAIRALGMRLIYGHNFRDLESANHNTALVNQALALRIAPGAGSLGLYLTQIYPGAQSLRIVGVVQDVHESSLFAPAVPTVYLPFNDYGLSNVDVVFRGRGATSYADAYSTVRSAVHSVAPGAVLTRFRSLSAMVGAAAQLTRYTAYFLAALAGLGLFLVAVCAWADSTSHAIRREHEIGIRLALGAERNRLARAMAARQLAPCLLAACLGALVAYWLSGLIGFLFHGTSPALGDFVLGVVMIVTLATLASIGAFQRSTRRRPSDLLGKSSN